MKLEGEIVESKSELDVNTSSTANNFSFDVIGYLKHLSHKWAGVIVFLILWQVIPTLDPAWAMFIPTPTTIAVTMWDMIFSSDFIMNTAITMSRVLIGFGIAVLFAIPLGYLLGGFFKDFEKAIDPLLQLLGQLNPFSFLHIILALIGLGELSIIATAFYIAQWPILYNTVTGIKNVDPVLTKAARSVSFEKFDIFWKVLMPASLPTVFAGMRLGAILAFFMVMGAEMMGASDGLGYMIMWDQMYGLIPQMWVGIVTMSLMGIAFDKMLMRLEKHYTSWKEDITFH